MSSLESSNAIPLTQLSIGFASIGATFTSAGSFTSPVITMQFISTFNQPVQISFDGVNNHVVIPATSVVPWSFKNNRTAFANPNILVQQIGVAPTSGSLFICAFSASTP